jgi:transcriptional regulator with XRE-family HTH domain
VDNDLDDHEEPIGRPDWLSAISGHTPGRDADRGGVRIHADNQSCPHDGAGSTSRPPPPHRHRRYRRLSVALGTDLPGVAKGGAMGQRPRALDPSVSPRASFGAQLRSWRERRGLSQSELGRLAHVSGDLVGKLEKAQRRPVPDLVARLDDALSAGGTLVGAAEAVRVREGFAVGRRATRESEAASGWFVSAARLPPPNLQAAVSTWAGQAATTAPNVEVPDDPDSLPARVIADRVRQLRAMDDAGNCPQILDWTLHDLRWARTLLGDHEVACGSSSFAAMSRSAGQLAQLAGWLASDRGAYGAAEQLWLLGLGAAQAAGDVRLGATIVSCLSYQALWTGEPARALDLIALARQSVNGWSGGAFQALLATREARAHAGLGDVRGCERSLGQAGEWIGQADRRADPEWVYWVTPAVLAADAGRAWLELGDARRATAGLVRGLKLFGDAQPRNRALHLTSLASARLDDREVDGAVEAVGAALGLLQVSDSRRLRERLLGLLPVLDCSGGVGRRAADQVRSALGA